MEAAHALLPRIPPGEDTLPSDFGPPMESDHHRACMNRAIDVLRLHWADRPVGYVAGNMAMYFNELQVHRNDFLGPDLFVVSDAERRDRKSWVVWQEGLTPDVVVELLSPSTEARDRGEKMRIYARVLKVQDYVLFDPMDGRLEAWRWVDGQYQRAPADGDGQVNVSAIGLKLGVLWEISEGERRPWLRWYTASGELLPTPEEAQRARAEAAERRAEALAAQLRALGVDPDA